jgi:hypothetical protein
LERTWVARRRSKLLTNPLTGRPETSYKVSGTDFERRAAFISGFGTFTSDGSRVCVPCVAFALDAGSVMVTLVRLCAVLAVGHDRPYRASSRFGRASNISPCDASLAALSMTRRCRPIQRGRRRWRNQSRRRVEISATRQPMNVRRSKKERIESSLPGRLFDSTTSTAAKAM